MSSPAKIVDLKLPIVALVGRVNVGKSTLFNRILGKDYAIVSDIPGTTRTRNISPVCWRGNNFLLVDTGGLTFSDDVPLEADIIKQTEQAVKEADVIVLMVDIREGLLPQEKELAKRLRKFQDKTIILAANKADNPNWRLAAHNAEWRKLGLGEPFPLSAANGSGVGDLLDLIYGHLRKTKRRPKKIKPAEEIRVAIVGRPNVGKSTLFNCLIGEERVIVNPMAHTTREPHDTLVEYEGRLVRFVDTAGIRRKTKVSGELEQAGIAKSIAAIERADIVLLLLDAAAPITDQDQQLAGLLREHTKSVIIVVNKWDVAEANDDHFRNETKELIYSRFPHLDYAPIIFVSALTQYRVHQIFPLLFRAWNERRINIPDETLRDWLERATRRHLPSRGKGVRHPKILGLTQAHNNPPIFELKIKAKTSLNISYAHYLENRLREQFSFFAAPIIIRLSKSKKI